MMTFTRRRAPDLAVKCGMKVCPAILPSVAGALLLAGASLPAAPMVSVGPHIGLHFEADLEFKSLSNITMAVENDQAREDIILKCTPGLQFVLSRKAQSSTSRLALDGASSTSWT